MKKNNIKNTVNICGIIHEIIETENEFTTVNVCGEINYKDCVIKIEKNATDDFKKETIAHEILHGILTHLGYDDLSENEQFICAVSNALIQSFEIKFLETGTIVQRIDIPFLKND